MPEIEYITNKALYHTDKIAELQAGNILMTAENFNEEHKKNVIFSMQKYVDTKQELDKFLEKLITPIIKEKDLQILDAGCGIGHICKLLNSINPKLQILGIDKESFLINEAKKQCKDFKNISFVIDDILSIQSKYHKKFDICINWKVLSWISSYEEYLKVLFSTTTRHIFLSSLFYDGDIDFQIKVTQYQRIYNDNFFKQYYNIYSLPRFKKFCYDLGARNIETYDFKIELDIPRPPPDKMGTYTVRTQNNNTLQISGAIIMSWKIIRIDL